MSCGCSAPKPDMSPAAIMCGACPRRVGFVSCSVDGKPLLSRPCPLGKHPDTQGRVRWLWIRWYGVPAPLRWHGLAGLYSHTLGIGANVDWRALPGCGCVVWLKDRWVRLTAPNREPASYGSGTANHLSGSGTPVVPPPTSQP